MTDEKLIEEAAKAIWDADTTIPETWDNKNVVEWDRNTHRGMARAALAVFEKAHIPTDDEREADARKYAADRYREVIYLSEYNAAVSAFVEGALWRRSVVPEPSAEPTKNTRYRWAGGKPPSEDRKRQGEPSDAQVEAAYQAWRQASVRDAVAHQSPSAMERSWVRAALRAAGVGGAR